MAENEGRSRFSFETQILLESLQEYWMGENAENKVSLQLESRRLV